MTHGMPLPMLDKASEQPSALVPYCQDWPYSRNKIAALEKDKARYLAKGWATDAIDRHIAMLRQLDGIDPAQRWDF